MSDPVCPGPTLWPIAPAPIYTRLYALIFLLIPFWGVVTGCSLPMYGWQLCVLAGLSL
jgi:hypothetical protein